MAGKKEYGKNEVTQILTLFNEDFIRGELDIRYNPSIYKTTLDTELLTLGFSSMANKLRSYFRDLEEQGKADSGRALVEETAQMIARREKDGEKLTFNNQNSMDSDEFAWIMRRYLLDGIYAEAEDLQENDLKTRDLKPDPVSGKKTYDFSPESWKTDNQQYKKALHTVAEHLVKSSGSKNPDRKQEYQERTAERILTKPSVSGGVTRREKIFSAYLINMPLEEAGRFLKKGWKTYGFDFNDDWDLYAAYLIQNKTVDANQEPEPFWNADSRRFKINSLPANQLQKVEDFRARMISEQEQMWTLEYDYWRRRKQGEWYIREWAWKWLVSQNSDYGQKSALLDRKRQLEKGYFNCYQALKEYAQAKPENRHNPALSQYLRRAVAERKTRVRDFAFYCLNESQPHYEEDTLVIRDPNGNRLFEYCPFYKYNKTEQLYLQCRKLESADELTRDDLISLAIYLNLTWDGASYLLSIAGFYKIYVCDIFEFALAQALYSLEQQGGSDGIRIRVDGEFREALKKPLKKCLEERVSLLKKDSRKSLKSREPGWLKDLGTGY